MTLPDYLTQVRERLDKATPGPLFERTDLDYYQGGCYLGIEPYSYNGPAGEQAVHLDQTGENFCGYFRTDVCRIENSGDKSFLMHASTDISRLLEIVEIYREALKEIIVTDGTMYIHDISETALQRAEEIVK